MVVISNTPFDKGFREHVLLCGRRLSCRMPCGQLFTLSILSQKLFWL